MPPCLTCGSSDKVTLLDLGRQPVSSHYLAAPGDAVPERDLALALCQRCGLVQLEKPFPFRDLTPPYDWISYREPESHLDAVADDLRHHLPRERARTAAGLSAKDGTTLQRLQARGFARVWTVDPRGDLGADNANAGIESVQGLLTAETAAAMAARHGRVDVLVARHILEHAEAPARFLDALGELVAPDGLLVLEVPDCTANLARQDYTMIWEEHALYFTPATLLQAIDAAGWESIGLKIHPFAFEDVIVVYARRKPRPNGRAAAVSASPAVGQTIALARAYAAGFEDWTQRYRRVLEMLTQQGKPVAAYGAGHLTCAFINFHRLADQFAFVVDDTPHKQGLHLPGSGLPIVAKDRLTAERISACLFGLAPEIEDKVIANNAGYAGAGGRFYSMFVDSPRSIRTFPLPESKAG